MLQFRDFLIRSAAITDGAAMQSLIVSVLIEYGLQPDVTNTDADVLDIDRHYRRDGGEFFAVFHGNQLCGTMGIKTIRPFVCELRKMYLLPSMRGQGLGHFMLQLAQDEARKLGFNVMELETASILKEAIALYEKNGFVRSCGQPHVGRCDRIYTKQLI